MPIRKNTFVTLALIDGTFSLHGTTCVA